MKISQRKSRWIMGSVIGGAAIAVAVDHTRHRLPEPAPAVTRAAGDEDAAVIIIVEGEDTPSGMDASPDTLDQSPCSLTTSPCSL
jgi:hypothetical protein